MLEHHAKGGLRLEQAGGPVSLQGRAHVGEEDPLRCQPLPHHLGSLESLHGAERSLPTKGVAHDEVIARRIRRACVTTTAQPRPGVRAYHVEPASSLGLGLCEAKTFARDVDDLGVYLDRVHHEASRVRDEPLGEGEPTAAHHEGAPQVVVVAEPHDQLGHGAMVLADQLPAQLIVRVADGLEGPAHVEQAHGRAVVVGRVEDDRGPKHRAPPHAHPTPAQEGEKRRPDEERDDGAHHEHLDEHGHGHGRLPPNHYVQETGW